MTGHTSAAKWVRVLAGLALVAGATACGAVDALLEPAAARELDLTNSVWTVAEVRGTPLTEPASLVFPDLDTVTLSTACGADTATLEIDVQGSAMRYGVFTRASNPCPPRADAARESVIEALAAVEAWRVDSHEQIVLLGPDEQPMLHLGTSATEWR